MHNAHGRLSTLSLLNYVLQNEEARIHPMVGGYDYKLLISSRELLTWSSNGVSLRASPTWRTSHILGLTKGLCTLQIAVALPLTKHGFTGANKSWRATAEVIQTRTRLIHLHHVWPRQTPQLRQSHTHTPPSAIALKKKIYIYCISKVSIGRFRLKSPLPISECV